MVSWGTKLGIFPQITKEIFQILNIISNFAEIKYTPPQIWQASTFIFLSVRHVVSIVDSILQPDSSGGNRMLMLYVRRWNLGTKS